MKSLLFRSLPRVLGGAFGFLVFAFVAHAAAATTAATSNPAPTPEQTKAEIVKSLNDFLKFNGDAAQHDRFWADDLFYTSAAGVVKSKPDIMKGLAQAAETAKSTPPKADATLAAIYSAEDILVRLYGDTAALTFRLVAKYPDGKKLTYRNSGTLLHRNAKWQVITWQATKEPEPTK